MNKWQKLGLALGFAAMATGARAETNITVLVGQLQSTVGGVLTSGMVLVLSAIGAGLLYWGICFIIKKGKKGAAAAA